MCGKEHIMSVGIDCKPGQGLKKASSVFACAGGRLHSFRPETCKIFIPGIAPENRHILEWQWVCLSDLMRIVNGLVIQGSNRTVSSLSLVHDFLARYGILAGHDDEGKAIITWYGGEHYGYGVGCWTEEVPKHLGSSMMFIPSLLSNSVIDLVSHGIVSVFSRPCPDPAGVYTADEIPSIIHVLWGIDMDGVEHQIVSANRWGPHRLKKVAG
jgi:hypothetical protein